MKLEYLDIFRGTVDRVDVWLEAVAGLDEAKKRMEQIAEEKPGKYFVYCVPQQSVCASLDTGCLSNALH